MPASRVRPVLRDGRDERRRAWSEKCKFYRSLGRVHPCECLALAKIHREAPFRFVSGSGGMGDHRFGPCCGRE